jgi:uncharacterized protein
MQQLPFNHIGFREHLDEGRLMGARCTNCRTLHVPPRELCTHCFHAQMEWETLSGAGELVGFTIIHIGLPAMAAAGYDQEHPYCSGVVKLAEGPGISGQIVGVDSDHPETIRVGMPLRVVFVPREGHNELAFEPWIDSQENL